MSTDSVQVPTVPLALLDAGGGDRAAALWAEMQIDSDALIASNRDAARFIFGLLAD